MMTGDDGPMFGDCLQDNYVEKHSLLDRLLCGFRWYRKLCGGKWARWIGADDRQVVWLRVKGRPTEELCRKCMSVGIVYLSFEDWSIDG